MESLACSRCGSRFGSEHSLSGHRRHCSSLNSVAAIKVIKSDSYCYDIQCNNEATYSNDDGTATSEPVYDDRLPCSPKYLDVQNTIAQAMDVIRYNSLKDIYIIGLLKIHVFIEHKKLSAQDTKDLFEILVKFNPDWCIEGLQRGYNVLTSKTDKMKNKIFEVESFSYSIPRLFTDGHHNIYEGHHLNILNVVADMMLSMDQSWFTFNDYGEDHMVFAEPSKGLVCRKMERYIHKTYGEDYYPLPLVVSFDGLVLNKISTRNAKPVYIQLACVKSEKYMSNNNIRCVGFAPQLQVYAIYVVNTWFQYCQHVYIRCNVLVMYSLCTH